MTTIIIGLLFLSGCNSMPTIPTIITSGTSVLNTSVIDGKLLGFSFNLGDTLRYPNSANIEPDMVAFVVYDQTGRDGGVSLASTRLINRSFQLIANFTSVDSATGFFQLLGNIPDTSRLNPFVLIHKGQVWAVKTHDDKFSKILIKDIIVYIEQLELRSHAAITFEWAYQPDGTLEF